MNKTRFVVTVTFKVKHAYANEFYHAMILQASNSLLLEPDCLVFHVCKGATDTDVFLYEHYASEQAFEAHLNSSHYQQFDQKVHSWVESKSVQTWTWMETDADV